MDLDLQKLSMRPKKLLNIVFIGHVDAGKSTICGRILVDLNRIDERTLQKYKEMSAETNRASWYLSWCMDLNPEEREKGKTTEVGTATFDLPNTRVNVLDAPGHKQFVGEMIEGASRADVGVLVVSARINEFEAGFKGGQTKEHLILLKSGNVEKLIVLVNKMDESNWSESRFREIEEKVTKFTKNIFSDITFIPCDGLHGENIKTPFKTSFYDGPSFLDYLDGLSVNKFEGEPAMTVLEKVKTSGNTIFFVKCDYGSFVKDKVYRVLPQGKEDKITSICNEDDVEVTETEAGETYKIKVKDSSEELVSGHKIVSIDNKQQLVCTELYVHATIIESLRAVTVGYQAIFHSGINAVGCKVLDIISLDKKKLRIARKGEKVVLKLLLESPIVVVCCEEKKDRFSLRDESLTVASGIIRKVLN